MLNENTRSHGTIWKFSASKYRLLQLVLTCTLLVSCWGMQLNSVTRNVMWQLNEKGRKREKFELWLTAPKNYTAQKLTSKSASRWQHDGIMWLALRINK